MRASSCSHKPSCVSEFVLPCAMISSPRAHRLEHVGLVAVQQRVDVECGGQFQLVEEPEEAP